VRQTILDSKGSRSRPELGLVLLQFETLNRAGETVMRQTNWSMIGRRTPSTPEGQDAGSTGAEPRPGASAAQGPPPDGASSHFERAFDDVDVGTTEHLGSYTFAADTIVRYAEQFDPQRFHLDEAFARTTYFGGLAASGWHTAAAWMSLLVARRQAAIAAVAARGGEPPRFGPSPGITELRWRKPVLAGDTLLCTTTVVDKRASASRPEWGIVSNHNGAWNQRGELVFEFKASNFWGRRAG
jgi:acyl dehydratase